MTDWLQHEPTTDPLALYRYRDGIVAVVPVEKFFLIRTRAEATPDEFWPKYTR